MKIVILAVGKMRSAPAAELVKDYVLRSGRFAPVVVMEVKGEGDAAPARIAEMEGNRLVGALTPRDMLVACDERGETLSSTGLADLIKGASRAGGPGRLFFAVGGPEGISDEVRERASRLLALSRMTLSHELARVVLAEQIYRALAILNGHPYHRG